MILFQFFFNNNYIYASNFFLTLFFSVLDFFFFVFAKIIVFSESGREIFLRRKWDRLPLSYFMNQSVFCFGSIIIKKMEEELIEHCKQTLKKNQFEPIKKLGKGGFGLVFLVSKTNYSNYQTELYSVKCTSKKQFIKKPMLRRYLKQEISILQSLQHQNIVRLIRTFEDNGWIFMLMEYCDLGNIATIQNQKKESVFSFSETSQIVSDVISGIQYMHERSILHRDIKPENILRMMENNRIVTRICDLGFARQAKQDVDTFCGTTYYMAPELFQKKKYDKTVDIWAIGVLIFSMLFGCVPFKAMNMEAEIISKCENGFELEKAKKRFNSSIDDQKKNNLAEMFRLIFNLNPQERPDLDKILEYFRREEGRPQVISYKELQSKKNIDTQNSEDQSQTDLCFEIEKVNFIQTVLSEVRQLDFLDQMQLLFLKYYLDKACLSILQANQSLKLNEGERKFAYKISENINKNHKVLCKSLSQCKIPDLMRVFNEKKLKAFNEYKEEYRIVVGHAFHKAHKRIESAQLKIRTKLKLLCCHVINRVFEKQHRKVLFGHYFNWQERSGRPDSFELKEFKSWVQTDKLKRINETVEAINNKFYKKNK